MMRLLAIGDVHGNLDRLTRLLKRVCLRQDDQLVMLGDYIDRGPDSKGVISALIELRARYPQSIFLRGNHEQMLLDALFELGFLTEWKPLRAYAGCPEISYVTDRLLFELNGGLATLLSYAGDSTLSVGDGESVYGLIPLAHINFLKSTDTYFINRNFLFVHAGVNDQDPLGENTGPRDLLWQRKFRSCRVDGLEMTLVHGHSPCPSPVFSGREINLDTGAGYGGVLTCCDVLTGMVWQE